MNRRQFLPLAIGAMATLSSPISLITGGPNRDSIAAAAGNEIAFHGYVTRPNLNRWEVMSLGPQWDKAMIGWDQPTPEQNQVLESALERNTKVYIKYSFTDGHHSKVGSIGRLAELPGQYRPTDAHFSAMLPKTGQIQNAFAHIVPNQNQPLLSMVSILLFLATPGDVLVSELSYSFEDPKVLTTIKPDSNNVILSTPQPTPTPGPPKQGKLYLATDNALPVRAYLTFLDSGI